MRLIKYARLFRKIHEHKRRNKFILPYRLEVSLTYACNSRCRICRIWDIYRKNPELTKKELRLEEWNKLFRYMDKNLYMLALTGGEPFLRSDIDRLIGSAAANCRNLMLVVIATNGLMPEVIHKKVKRILKQIPKDINLIVTISLDGPPDVNNMLRGVKDSFENSRKTYSFLKNLKKRYKNLEVIREITISQHNIRYIPGMMKALNRQKVRHNYTFAFNCEYFRNNEIKMENENIRKIIRLIKKQKIAHASIFHRIIERRFLNLADKYYSSYHKQVVPCYSSWATVFIDPYGNVQPCINEPISLGNIKEHGFELKKVLSTETARKVRHDIKKGRCLGCWTPCEAYTTIMQNMSI